MPLADPNKREPAKGVTEPRKGVSSEARPAGVEGLGARLPPALAAGPSLVGLLRALRRRWLLAVGLGLALGIAAGAGTWFLPSFSRGEAYVLVRVAGAPGPLVFNTGDGGMDLETQQKTQAALVKRRSVLEAALRDPEVAALPVVREQREQAAAWLERELVVDTTLGPEVLRIALRGERTDQVVKVLNAVTTAYLAESERMAQAERSERLDKVTAATSQQEDDLRRKKQVLRELTGNADDTDTATRQRVATEQLSHAQSELFQVRSELASLQADLEAHQPTDPAVPDYLVEEKVNERLEEDAAEQARAAEVASLEQRLGEIRRVAVDPEAQSAQVRRQLETLRAAREARRSQVRAGILRSLQEKARADSQSAIADAGKRKAVLKERERLLADQVKRLDDDAHPSRRFSPEAEKLRAEISQSENIARKVSEQAQALKIEMAAPPRVTLLQQAVAAPREDRGRLQTAGLAGLSIFACTLLGVSWWEFRSRRVSTPDEVAQVLGLRPLGALPRLRDRARNRPADPGANQHLPRQNLLNESIDVTRTLLIHEARESGVQVVMVTSAAEGEGKTTLASHLAASLARAGRKTLLIDGDLRKPAAHRLFDLPLEPGFSELLRGEVNVADVIRPTRLSRLWLIAAGLCDSHATQALAQDILEGAFEELRGQFDFIVIDASPVLPVADSLLVGQYVDGVILSILRDASRLPQVHAASQRLTGLGIRLLGAVVNGVADNGYGYGSGAVRTPAA